METNKFEELIGKKLKEREIPPAAASWDKISEQLNGSRKARKRTYMWYAVAAGFIGILLVSILFIEQDTIPNGGIETIVNAPNGNDERPKDDRLPTTDLAGEPTFEKGTSNLEKPRVHHNRTSKHGLDNNLGPGTEIVGHMKEESEKEDVGKHGDAVIDGKIAEVIVMVDLLNMGDHTVTDSEVDSLLRQAQRDILRGTLFGEEKTVNAMTLLTEVEGELDKSFRDQIFESLKNGYFKVRTAVADRNK